MIQTTLLEGPVLGRTPEPRYQSDGGFPDAIAGMLGAEHTRAHGTTVLTVARIATPIGGMVAGATEAGLGLLEFADPDRLQRQLRTASRALGASVTSGRHRHIDHALAELAGYFAGSLQGFTVPLVLAGTSFQEAVWSALRGIPYGRTVSYEGLARGIGRPRASRAVGGANGQNRLAVILPCHRVIGSNGQLTGYGGGMWRKRFLLDLEQARPPA